MEDVEFEQRCKVTVPPELMPAVAEIQALFDRQTAIASGIGEMTSAAVRGTIDRRLGEMEQFALFTRTMSKRQKSRIQQRRMGKARKGRAA